MLYNISINIPNTLYKILIQLINERKDWFLDELVVEMAKRTSKVVSIPTLWRSLDYCGITRKKVYLLNNLRSYNFFIIYNYLLIII